MQGREPAFILVIDVRRRSSYQGFHARHVTVFWSQMKCNLLHRVHLIHTALSLNKNPECLSQKRNKIQFSAKNDTVKSQFYRQQCCLFHSYSPWVPEVFSRRFFLSILSCGSSRRKKTPGKSRGQFNKETTSVSFFTAEECACKFPTYNWLNPI